MIEISLKLNDKGDGMVRFNYESLHRSPTNNEMRAEEYVITALQGLHEVSERYHKEFSKLPVQ